MKVPLLSRSEGGGGGLLARALGTVALATVFAVSVGAGLATAAQHEQPAGPSGPAASASAKPILKVTVIGDSYTSGEGASSSTYSTTLAPDMTEDGIPFQSMQVNPQHQSSTAPTLQALNQIQAANPGVDIQVSFVPVSGATRDSLYQKSQPGTPFEQAPQIDAVKGADIVIVGIGGNDAKFSSWIKTALFSTDAQSAQAFPGFMQTFNDGTYLADQTKLLNNISDLAAPGATIISLGYPKAMPDTIPNSSALWNPFSWSTISQGEATLSNQLATTLNTNNQDASFLAQSQHPGQTWLYADVSSALQGHELFTSQEGLNGYTPTNQNGSYHPNDLGQQLLASVLQPYVEQAVNGQLSKWGVQGTENVPPVTPTFSNQWNLRVDVPLQMQGQQPNQPPATPPAADQPNTPPAQDTPPAKAPSDQPTDQGKPADQGKNQPDGTDQAKPAESAPEPATPAQPDAGKPDTTAVGPEVSKPTPPDAPSSTSPDASKPATPADTPSAGTPPAPADTPATPADTQPAKAPADATGTPAGADTPAAPADTPGARTPADGTAATPGQTDTPGGTPADTQPAANTPGTPAAPDNPAAIPPAPAAPAPGDTPAAPAAGDTPAAPAVGDTPAGPAAPPAAVTPAAPPAADTPAAPPAADTPAAPPAPVAPAPVDTPAAPAPVDTPPAPVAPAPVIVPPAPVAPPPVDIPAPALPAPIVIPDPAPIITPPVDIAPPPPVIAPPAPPPVVPVNPVDTGSSSGSGLGSVDGLGSGSTDTGLGSGLDSGGGIDTGGFTGGDGGGD